MRIAGDGSICILRRSAFNFAESKLGRFRTTANPIPLPESKPRAVGLPFIVPSIRSREVAWVQRSGVRHRESAL
jgi:hypothetical protein